MSALAGLSLLVAAEVSSGALAAAPDGGPERAAGALDASSIHTGIGPWGGVAHADTGLEAASSWSLGFEYSALAYMNLGRLTARYRHLYRIGCGQAGFDAGADVDVQVGTSWSLAERQAIVARVGARGYIYGNDRLFASLLELPALEAGYQLLSPSWHVELLGRAGLALLGKHRVLDEPSDDVGGTPMYGVAAALGWRTLHAEMGWAALGTDGHRIDATGCAIVGKLGLCAELARLSTGTSDASGASGTMRGDTPGETSQTITIWLSVGASERK